VWLEKLFMSDGTGNHVPNQTHILSFVLKFSYWLLILIYYYLPNILFMWYLLLGEIKKGIKLTVKMLFQQCS